MVWEELGHTAQVQPLEVKGLLSATDARNCLVQRLCTEHVARMHQIKSVLERYGHPVVVLTESRVGYVIHDDAFQVVAEPFSETQTG